MQPRPATHREVLSFLWHYTREYKELLSCMMTMLVGSIGLGLLQPFFYKEAVDIVATGVAHDQVALSKAIRMVGVGVLLGALHIALHEMATMMLAWMQTRIMVRAHMDVFAHVQRLSTQFHVNAFAGATSRKVGRGTDAMESMLDHLWFNFVPLVLNIFGFIIILYFFAPLIGIAILLSMLLYVPLSVVLNLYHARFHSWTDKQDTRVTASMVDAITGNATVKAFGAEHAEEERHSSVMGEWQRRMWQTWRLGNILSHFQSLCLMLIELTLLLIALFLWYRGEFTAGGFVVVIFYVGRLWGFMRDIGKEVRNYLRAVAHVEEMVGLSQTPLCVADIHGAKPLRVMRGAVHFGDVTFSYTPHARPVFAHFSVDIEAGEKVALVGHSGGGKSTFVKLLLRFYDLQGGKITIDGQDIAGVTQKSLRTSIGLMPQDPLLFHRSIAENIAYGKPYVSRETIEEVAKLAHAHEFIGKLPKGYETLVGERGVKLSGGERQRVAIARAILADTPILVLDEATSSLDSLSEKYIQEALDILIKGRTTIVIAHRLSTIKKVDRILVIEEGRIAEEGFHSKLVRKKDGLYRRFYELQAGGFIGE